MGGLRKGLPITYWTFLIGAIAIAGVPPLAGFFSKDEILWKTFAGGHRIMWIIGADHVVPDGDLHVPPGVPDVPRRTPSWRAAPAHHGDSAGHGHADESTAMATAMRTAMDHLHDAPPAMALALIVLAIGSVLAGGSASRTRSAATTGSRRSSSPSFEAHAMAPATEFQVSEGRPGVRRPRRQARTRTHPRRRDEQDRAAC